MIRPIAFRLLPALLMMAAVMLFGSGSAHAQFNAGRIIDDSVFTNKNAMSVSDIQNFLNTRVPSCDPWHSPGSGSQGEQPPWRCLRDYYENPSTRENNLDGRGVPAGGISAAQIIYNAAQTYNINPQVILVTLQKENGLITDSWPYDWQYRTAMGMGCPDGAPCDSQYFGFANQINQGTRHLAGFYNQNAGWYIPYRPGVSYIKWHPNSACGGTNVNIENRATASLYSYTPYQPNGAALGNMYGTGDGCSSYGNRNFWRDFTNWFGSTYTPSYQWEWVGQSADKDITQLAAGNKATLYLTAKNTGTATWYNNGSSPIDLITSRPTARGSSFHNSAWRNSVTATRLNESTVSPGQNGTFTVVIQAPSQPGTYNEYFNLVAQNIAVMNDVGLFWQIGVIPATLAETTMSVSAPSVMPAESTATVTLTIRNDSNIIWYSDERFPVRLGNSSPLERASPFYHESWLSTRRPAAMTPGLVSPGQNATFSFTIKAPRSPGNYIEKYSLLAENLSWFNEVISVPIQVKAPYTWAWSSQGSYTDSSKTTPVNLGSMSPGQTAWLVVRAQNTGTATWYNNGQFPVRIGTFNPIERTSRFASDAWIRPSRPTTMAEASVAPGEIGTFEFPVRVPSGGGTWREYFNLLAENKTWMNEDVGQFFPITVH